MPRWQRDRDGTAHRFTHGVADCDVIHEPVSPADDQAPRCPDCLALLHPELGFAPSWQSDLAVLRRLHTDSPEPSA